MTGIQSSLIARIRAMNPDMIFNHCMIHRQALAAKNMQPDLHDVHKDVIKVVNFVKSSALNSRMFSKLCENMEPIHRRLLFHSEVRWLSHCKVLERVFELRKELWAFLPSKTSVHDEEFFSNFHWLVKLAYLSDIFQLINKLNLEMQGGCKTILEMSDKINAFIKKMVIWKSRLADGITDMFPLLTDFLDKEELTLDVVSDQICGHLTAIVSHFNKYFDDIKVDDYDWMRNPFAARALTSSKNLIRQKRSLMNLAVTGH